MPVLFSCNCYITTFAEWQAQEKEKVIKLTEAAFDRLHVLEVKDEFSSSIHLKDEF